LISKFELIKQQKQIEEKEHDIKKYEYIILYKAQLNEKLSNLPGDSKDFNTLKDEVIILHFILIISNCSLLMR